jgi:acetate kinase
MDVLAVNSGSSSLKLRVVASDGSVLARADHPADATGALERFLADAPPVGAAAHRFVHGGRLREPALLGADVLAEVEAAAALAPLHTRVALGCARELVRLRPDLPQVACFDTAFHSTLPEAAATYAVPREWRERHGLRRYGFHGLSHAWSARRAPEVLGRRPAEMRIVSCHLGSGVSLAAVADGRSVDTTMGMTPNEGVPMATRSGAVDPGALLLMVEREGGAAAVRDALEHRSGLLGLSEASGDMRTVLAAAGRGDELAALALAVYVHRLRGAVAAMAAAMGGLDVLTFTGGVGENAPRVRAEVCEGLGFLGVRMDAALNGEPGEDALNGEPGEDAPVSPPGAPVPVLVIHAREEAEMAMEARRVLGGPT